MQKIAQALVLVIVALSMTLTAAAQSQPQWNALEELDKYFANLNRQISSGCDPSTWEDIHRAVRADLTRQELLPSSVDADISRINAISRCYQLASDKETEAYKTLAMRFIGQDKELAALLESLVGKGADGKAVANWVTMQVTDVREKNLPLLDSYVFWIRIESFEQEAIHAYTDHARVTGYRDLVNQYNALANSLARVQLAPGYRLGIDSRPLHCESRMDLAGVTYTDCR